MRWNINRRSKRRKQQTTLGCRKQDREKRHSPYCSWRISGFHHGQTHQGGVYVDVMISQALTLFPILQANNMTYGIYLPDQARIQLPYSFHSEWVPLSPS
jgi:hypothetical protein